MKIDQSNPPTEVWHINRERIRKGLGVQRLTPESNSWWHSALFGGEDDRKDTIMCDAVTDMAAAVLGADQLSEAELNQLIEDLK